MMFFYLCLDDNNKIDQSSDSRDEYVYWVKQRDLSSALDV